MALGTAGFTAALSVLKLEQAGVQPGDGDILVTGATGGVGSIAVAILNQGGYRVVAATGKSADAGFLRQLVPTSTKISLAEGEQKMQDWKIGG